tara:strand:- start:11027 stop:11767 length:741 start_codon:yes stop_codon:yes gene_type:complete
MLSNKEAKTQIIAAMREIFPTTLPCKVQEARTSILAHMGMERDDFGFHPSGKFKFDSHCSEAVKVLKASGEMTTSGWTWVWEGSQPIQMVVQPTPTEDDFDLSSILDVNIEYKAPSLYNLNDEETLIRLVAITPCFGKVVQSDNVCQGCPLFNVCLEKKGEVALAKKEARSAKKEALNTASEAGYDLKGVKIPKSARLHEARDISCKAQTSCIVSGEAILKGELAVLIPSWGMVKKVIADAYRAMQ